MIQLDAHSWDDEESRALIHATADAVFRACSQRCRNQAHRMVLQLERLIVKAEQRRQAKEKAA